MLAWRNGAFGKPDPGLTPQQVAGMTSNSEWTGVPLRSCSTKPASSRTRSGFSPKAATRVYGAQHPDRESVWTTRSSPGRRTANRCGPSKASRCGCCLPGWEGNTNVKWLRRLELGTRPWMTRWETATYTDPLANGTARQFSFEMDARSIITSPAHPETIERGWRRDQRTRVERPRKDRARRRQHRLGQDVERRHARGARALEGAHALHAHVGVDGRRDDHLSRATDETGYVQPTRAELMRVRGAGTQYHFNPIYGWRVMPNGRVFFHGDT